MEQVRTDAPISRRYASGAYIWREVLFVGGGTLIVSRRVYMSKSFHLIIPFPLLFMPIRRASRLTEHLFP